MPRHRRTVFPAILAISLVLAVWGTSAGQHEIDPRVRKILEDWKARRAYPPISYEIEGRCVTTKEHMEQLAKSPKHKVKPKDYHTDWNVKLLIDVKGNRHRFEGEKEYIHIGNGSISREWHLLAFDGNTLWTTSRRVVDGKRVKWSADSADVYAHTGNFSGFAFHYARQLEPLFASQGVVRFLPKPDVIPGQFDRDPDLSALKVHRTDVFDDRPCLVLRQLTNGAENYEEYWIDPDRGSALVRHLTVSKQFPLLVVKARYRQHGPYWLVDTWSFESRGWNEAEQPVTRGVDNFRVTKVVVEKLPEESRFRLPVEPGMTLRRRHHDPKAPPIVVK